MQKAIHLANLPLLAQRVLRSSIMLGSVTLLDGRSGTLVHLPKTDRYVLYACGSVSSVPQNEARQLARALQCCTTEEKNNA